MEDYQQTTIPLTSCVLLLLAYILSGGAIFSAWEDWAFLDGAYFCFVSLMTIGFGDFVPGNYYIYNIDQNISTSEANAKGRLLKRSRISDYYFCVFENGNLRIFVFLTFPVR